ncbi:MAG: hypothetical protein DWH91_16600 [Planctomycetota bacterium]|nr:MAG: hypothetical protein DWH91_16600 [Planctomycetota bacterium]
MAHAYTPGLQVMERTRFRAVRTLPISGQVLKQVGDRVSARDVVAETLLPGDIFPVNLANQLAINPGEVPGCLLKDVGDSIQEGELLARSPGMFGLFQAECLSKHTGTVESVSRVTGQAILRGAPLPVRVLGYVAGEVVEIVPNEGVVVETEACLIQGIFGIGGEAYGEVVVVCKRPDEDLSPEMLRPEHQGRVVVGGRRILGTTINRARELGVTAIVAGGIDDQDLRDILGYDLGVAITGTETMGITVIVTEGFGEIAMADRTFSLFQLHSGQLASVNGATQIRAGVIRPEVVIPLPSRTATNKQAAAVGGGVLDLGTPVRIIRDPHFGVLGTVSALPSEPHVLPTGSRARVLEVLSADGTRRIIPRANVEIVST